MKFFGNKSLAVSVAIMAMFAGGVQSASADDLFKMLFGGGVKKRNQVGEFPAPPPPAGKGTTVPRQKAAIARITGPSYYTYKADALERVNFAALAALPQTVSTEPAVASSSFREAIATLDGFDLLAEKDFAKALTDYYAANPDFIWVTDNAVNSRAEQALRVLASADNYGLAPADYSVVVPSVAATGEDSSARLSELIRFEMTLSAKVLRYVHDAEEGRVDPNRISGYHDLAPKPLDLPGVLNTLAHTDEARTYLESRHPQNPEYQALRVELEALKATAENEIVVDPKLLLKPGGTSAELPKVMKIIARDLDDEMGGEFGETLLRMGSSETYGDELVQVVKAAQKKAGLKPDGVIGPRTVATFAGVSKADRLDKVVFALEQMRWLPSDLGSPRVFINQPAFMAYYIEGREAKLSTRVVIGRPSNQTTFFTDEIEQVDYNPYWGVPQSIIVNEMLPRLQRDPGYLDRAGYEVTDAKGKRVPSSAVNWGQYGAKVPYNVRQAPSEANALGELKILFPNKHAIYMHDTPSKSLFERDSRAFSHGCVRLADPRGMAAAVLGTSVDYVADKLKKGHSSEKVTRKIPVYVAYFTAWPTLEGKVEYFDDVYDRDSHLKTAMEKTDAVRVPSS